MMTNYFYLLTIIPFLHNAAAFSSIVLPRSGSNSIPANEQYSNDSVTSTSSTPWRLVLDIGREPLSSMPFDWARSGCRMPLVIPCDFQSDQTIQPQSDTVSFTGPDGAVISPIEGGTWKLSNNNKVISLSLTLPEKMERRDVYIPEGSTLTLEGTVFTKPELDNLNQAFYEARDKAWEIGGELNEMAQRQEAPKKWNEDKGQWEKRYPTENIVTQLQKRVALWGAQTEQKKRNNQRPNPNTLSSDQGILPGLEHDVYIQKEGVIKLRSKDGAINDAVLGKWSAEPILANKVVSYYNS